MDESRVPNDPIAERQILEDMLLYPFDSIPAYRSFLTEQDFFTPANRLIYKNLLVCFDAQLLTGGNDDAPILRAHMERNGDLERIGGAATIGRIIGES